MGHAGSGRGAGKEICLCSLGEYEQLLEGKSAEERHGALIVVQKPRERASNMSQLSFSFVTKGNYVKHRGRDKLRIIYGV